MAAPRLFDLLQGAYALGECIWNLALLWHDITTFRIGYYLSRTNAKFRTSPRVLATLSTVNLLLCFNYAYIVHLFTLLLTCRPSTLNVFGESCEYAHSRAH